MTEQDRFDRIIAALTSLADAPPPNPMRQASARRAFLERAAQLRAEAPAGRPARGRIATHSLRLATALFAALLLALGGITGLVHAADAARPGDRLYPLDLGMEALQLALTPHPDGAARLLLAQADERLQEAENLATDGDTGNMLVALDGYGRSIAALARAVGNEKEPVEEDLVALLDEALSVHETRLEQVRQRAPEAALSGLDRAIEASRQGRQDLPPAGRPDEAGPPDDKPGRGEGRPDDGPGGPPEDRGRPDKTPGPPDGRPNGPPQDHGRPDKP